MILWAFPLSLERIELGFYHDEDWPVMASAAAGMILLAELIFRLPERRQKAGPTASTIA